MRGGSPEKVSLRQLAFLVHFGGGVIRFSDGGEEETGSSLVGKRERYRFVSFLMGEMRARRRYLDMKGGRTGTERRGKVDWKPRRSSEQWERRK
jgi:hypothetical protein